MTKVYKVMGNGDTTEIERVRCRDEDAELQKLLEKNLDLLPGEQINPDDPRRWLLVKREMPVPDPGSGLARWSIDFLLLDQDATPTFIECKRFNDTRSRREVVGQMLEYVANGHHYWTRDDLREMAEQAAQFRGTDLESALASLRVNGDLSLEEFFDQAEVNLREGQVRLVFFLEEAPWELKSIVDFLNKQMERSEVLLVEARQFRTVDSAFVVPTLFGYTEEARLAKSSVRIASRRSPRRKWDEPSFFADAHSRLSGSDFAILQGVYSNLPAGVFDVSWGTGAARGSFNIALPSACPRSLFSFYSDGMLHVNLEWLKGSEAGENLRSRVFEFALKGLKLPIESDATYPTCPISDWGPKAGLVRAFLTELARSEGDGTGGSGAQGA